MTENKCPKCNEGESFSCPVFTDFACGSVTYSDGRFIQSSDCEVIALRAELARLRQTNESLREALKPFAEVGKAINRFPHFKDTDSLWGTDTVSIKVRDLRRASAALAPTSEKKEQTPLQK